MITTAMPEHLKQFEERGLKYLRAFANGQTPQGKAAREKLALIERMQREQPAAYRALLEKNYQAEAQAAQTIVESAEAMPAAA